MGTIEIPGPTALFVRWDCRRCGHKGGFAQTTIPVTKEWNEDMMRELFAALTVRLAEIHLRGQGCVAAPADFIISRGAPEDRQISGLL
jgi:hypothetical protein